MSSTDRKPWTPVLRLVFAVWLAAAPARGEPPVEPGERVSVASARVAVNLVGEIGRDQAFATLLREWLDASEIDHVIESQPALALADLRSSSSSGPRVRIWLVLRTAGKLRLYLAEPGERRYLVRDIPLPSGLDELSRERTAQVVLSSALAFLERRASTPWPEVERAFAEPVETPARAGGEGTALGSPVRREPRYAEAGATWELGVGAWYSGVASDGLAHGPGAVVDVGIATSRWRFAGVARGLYRFWPEASSPRVRVAARGPNFGLGGSMELVLGSGFRPFLELGAGVDVVRLTPHHVPESDVDTRPPRDDLRAFGALAFGFKWRARNVWLGAGARAEWAFADTHYDVATARTFERELSLPRLRPGGFLEVGWLIAARD
jgi:hypothetical protein